MASSNNQRQGILTSGWKNTVRIALATGATVATLIGTQVLALADQNSNSAANPQNTNNTPSGALNSTANTDINNGPVYVPADESDQQAVQNNTTSNQRSRQSAVNPAPNQPAPSTRSSRRG